ncbi:MAG: helix-turn-helix domain-containing protein [Oscillospiraceae bacterium]|nr:helix-turn-helix domain-containing protein [Oscillospiraceae bacterium]
MDAGKVGRLIAVLRKEKHLTQKELADALGLSDRTVSKWERGAGCPDISLLNALSGILGVNIEKLLSGEAETGEADGGNMKKTKFYTCPQCGNVTLCTGDADISCCGRRLSALVPGNAAGGHMMNVSPVEDEYFVTIDHEMSKSHYISFAACLGYDRAVLVKLYPEQSAELRLPRMPGARLFACCNTHGLWEQKI